MTSDELAQAVEATVNSLKHRVKGVGAAQYDDGSGVQRFERKRVADIAIDAMEEIDDLIVYAVQMRLRLVALLGRLPFEP